LNISIPALALSVLFGGYVSSAVSADVPARTHVFHYENVLGTSLDMKIRASSSEEANRAAGAALKEFDRENRILSAWTPNSEFSRWTKTRGTAEKVSPELFDVLALFDAWKGRTGGALDASAETAVQVWKNAAAENRMPTQAELNAAVAQMQRPHWRLDTAARTATHLDNAPIALNSFAKSYITGHAADKALAAGANGVVLNVGGDIVLRGNMSDSVAIANPRADAENDPPADLVRLADETIATSGDYRRGVDVSGVHYSHILDPRTAQAAEHVLSSTVVAADPSEAGALATAFSVMTPDESAQLAKRLGGVEYLLMLRDGRTVQSSGWAKLEAPRAQTPRLIEASYSMAGRRAKSAAAAPAVPMDLMITLELAQPNSPRYRRPYVAVWVRDAENRPVRLISLWSEKPRYLNELREWYHDYPVGMRYGGEISPNVSSATRPAGKYTLRWDGKDDKGNAVKPGKYTIMIEAVREHGGYDLMHQEIDFDGKAPAAFTLPGRNEIAGVQLDYGRHTE
jgi:FAD:protein FMN transferase